MPVTDSTLPHPVFTMTPTMEPSPEIAAPSASITAEAKQAFRGSTSLRDDARTTQSSQVMIIDDEPLVVRVVRRFLQSAGYTQFCEVTDSRRAIESIQTRKPDVILLDINMPHVNGLEILRMRQNLTDCAFTPVIILSADSDSKTKNEALQLGATEFLKKPVDPHELILRVQNAVIVKAHQDHLSHYAEELEREVAKRTHDLEKSRELIIQCLARAAEFRDNETGQHVVRVGKYAALIAEQLGFSPTYCHRIELAAQLHDVGKIGVSDSILLCRGKLTDDQMAIMQRHCKLGDAIIGPIAEEDSTFVTSSQQEAEPADPSENLSLLQMVSKIALTHHEKWDGTGYPHGLKGEEIPLVGRITAVADVFDALSTKRPYKNAFPLKKCLEIMHAEVDSRFDRRVFSAFLSRFQDVIRIYRKYADNSR